MTAPKNGFFYVLDAKTGEFIAGNPLVKVPWAEALDPKTGRPVEMAGAKRGWTVHNWWHMSYSPVTGLVYVPTTDRRATLRSACVIARKISPGEKALGRRAFDGRLVAWDPVSESVRWSVEQPIAVNSSTLSTAGNLVFQGEGTGEFSAYAADSGKKLWSLKTGSAIDATPVSFSAGGQQYIVVPVGWGSASRIFGPASLMATPQSKRGPSRLLAFRLGGTTPFPYPLNTVPQCPEAAGANSQQGSDTAGKGSLRNPLMQRVPFSGTRRERGVDRERSYSRPAIRSAASTQRMACDCPGRHSPRRRHARLRG